MSILIKGTNGGNISGSSSKGFPAGDISNIQYVQSAFSIKFKWNDPDDTIYDNAILSQWNKTYIVRKLGGFPESIKDGDIILENTERNKYKDNYFIDNNGLVANTIYYYRFFTESKTGLINNDSNQVVKVEALSISSILEENDWGVIANIAEEGNASKYWKVGDEKIVHITGTYAQDVTMQIWGFDTETTVDGSKAAITFGAKHLLNEKWSTLGNDSAYPKWGYYNCQMKRKLNDDYYAGIPENLRTRIKQINTYSYGYDYHNNELSKDYLWIPSHTANNPKMSNYSIFTDSASKIRTLKGTPTLYFTRDMDNNHYRMISIVENGNVTARDGDTYQGCLMCFCI